eukprot:743637-Pyramimonas_sp.AAC.1
MAQQTQSVTAAVLTAVDGEIDAVKMAITAVDSKVDAVQNLSIRTCRLFHAGKRISRPIV